LEAHCRTNQVRVMEELAKVLPGTEPAALEADGSGTLSHNLVDKLVSYKQYVTRGRRDAAIDQIQRFHRFNLCLTVLTPH